MSVSVESVTLPASADAPSAKAPRKASSSSKASRKTGAKRGPARPFRKLPQEVLDGRIGKLESRIRRASTQLEEAKGYLTKYAVEREYRQRDAPVPAASEVVVAA
jgi:hypothetical protein